jgi:hypothetical protein
VANLICYIGFFSSQAKVETLFINLLVTGHHWLCDAEENFDYSDSVGYKFETMG